MGRVSDSCQEKLTGSSGIRMAWGSLRVRLLSRFSWRSFYGTRRRSDVRQATDTNGWRIAGVLWD